MERAVMGEFLIFMIIGGFIWFFLREMIEVIRRG